MAADNATQLLMNCPELSFISLDFLLASLDVLLQGAVLVPKLLHNFSNLLLLLSDLRYLQLTLQL